MALQERLHDDLYTALKMVAQTHWNCLPEDKFYLLGNYETAHDLGRWMESALLMEHCIGAQIPEKAEKILRLHLRAMMNNPYSMLVNDPETMENSCLNHHNLREALMALSALVAFRGSLWARNSGENLLNSINRRFFQKTLTDAQMSAATGIPISTDPNITRPDTDPYGDQDATSTTGRAIEGMLRFYQATGSQLALTVMNEAVAFHRVHSINTDGSAPAWMHSDDHVGHNHSYLGTLRGLLLYGIQFNDQELINAVYNTYCRSIYVNNCTPSGFAPHDLAKRRFSDSNGDPLGDPASCADVAYIAYLLASCGYTDLLDDVERLIRGRLLFTQTQDGPDKGAWGIYEGYFGTASTIDVFALIASTLSIIYKDFITEDDQGLWIPLHFSKEHPSVSMEVSVNTQRCITLIPHKVQAIHVRIPGWCDAQQLSIKSQDGTPIPYQVENNFVGIPATAVTPELQILLTFPLPLTTTTEITWDSHIPHRIHWLGDSIISVDVLTDSEV